jgi:hypothetical protein
MARFRHQSLACIGIVLLIVGIGCTPQGSQETTVPPESPPAGWPEALSDFSVVWTAESAIDLTTGAAVVVRAYMESYYLAYLTGDEKYLYPGFQQSVNASDPDGPDGTQEVWPKQNHPETWIGTARHHLLRMERSGRDVAVVGCVYSYGTGVLTAGGIQQNIGGMGPYAGINAIRIGLQAPDGEQLNLPPQRGLSRTPFENVFDGWRVTNHQGGVLLQANWAGSGNDKVQCLSRADGTPESRASQSDFPALPATPGWPAKSS